MGSSPSSHTRSIPSSMALEGSPSSNPPAALYHVALVDIRPPLAGLGFSAGGDLLSTVAATVAKRNEVGSHLHRRLEIIFNRPIVAACPPARGLD
ncbi:MAG TPA: hypothetical protein PKK68_02585 [Methanothrix soehngenii]|nr:hypothetical protein [Methanothrix soehngenii]